MTSTSLTVLNGQLATETEGLCSLLWQAAYSSKALHQPDQDHVIEACLASLSILAGTTGLEQLSEPVGELRWLLSTSDSRLSEIEMCIERVTALAYWSRVSVLDQAGVAPT